MCKVELGISIIIFHFFLFRPSTVFCQDKKSEHSYFDLYSSADNPRNSEGDFVVLEDGRILFAYTRFTSSSSDHAPAQIMGRFSEDGGETWSTEDTLIVDREGDQNVMSVSFLRLENGDVALFYAQKNSLEDNIPQIRISKDDARSWTEPKPVISDQKGYFVLNNDRVIQLKSGRILAPVSLHKTPNSEWRNRGEIRCYYSDDNGISWYRGQVLPVPDGVISQEPCVVELDDGRVMMIMRASGGVQYTSFSSDQGITWRLAQPSNIPSPIAPASLERLNSTGDLILVWNNNGKSGPGYFKSKRTPLTMAISRNEGATWEFVKNVEGSIHASYAYTAIQEVDGHVLLGYYIKHDKKPGYDLRIKRLSIEDVYRNVKADPVLIVANKHSNTLSYVDPVALEVQETIDVGNNPHEITITPDQRFAYLSSYEPPGNSIYIVDLMKRQQIDTIHTGDIGRIHGAAMGPEGEHAYFTAGQSGKIVEVDNLTNTISRIIPTHGELSHMVYVSPDGKQLLTSNINSEDISVIDRTSGKLDKIIPAGKGVEGMAFTPDGKYLWALNQTGGTILVIDWINRKVLDEFECEGMPVRIAFTKDGKYALVAGWSEEGTLTIIDVKTKKEIKRIRVGDYAIGVEISPDGKYAFVGCEDSIEARVLPDGSESAVDNKEDSDGVHVVDLEKMEVVKIIKSCLGPDPMKIWFPPTTIQSN